jgi:hypothetical protein
MTASGRMLRSAALLLLTTAALGALGGGSASSHDSPNGAAAEKLGLTYGPYLGQRCRQRDYTHCRRIGIDVVFDRRATRVVAEVGGERVVLRTPGRHSGVRFRDWVGTFTRPDLHRHHSRPGTYLIDVPVEIHVHFADGRRAAAVVPRVLLSPGWG